jgi:hypothetical protein
MTHAIPHPPARARWVRPFHRWVSIVFTLTVAANFIAMAVGRGSPPPWITYAPLLPLALLLLTGLYLFALPYLGARGTPRSAGVGDPSAARATTPASTRPA